MKKYVIIILAIICIQFLILKFKSSLIDTKQNETYIETIFNEDKGIQRKYGEIRSYKVVKEGKSFGSNNKAAYDHYRILLTGEKDSGTIYIRLFKDKSGKLLKYEYED
ncbi:hypothetical protein [Acinetobacter seifertii]|uniref:hypothetical protein n=1 Tax=Acinetobacter seifertii TaxID=1530123 RepID=UPI0038626E43